MMQLYKREPGYPQAPSSILTREKGGSRVVLLVPGAAGGPRPGVTLAQAGGEQHTELSWAL